MASDTYNKLATPLSPRRWKRRIASDDSCTEAWSWEQIMARIAFVVVCLLLLGVWVHPYVSGAFDHTPGGAVNTALPSNMNSEPDSKVTDLDRPLVVVRGAEGFWRVGKTDSGVWWFISPTGQREFLNTVTTVQPFQLGREANGVHFASRDYNGTTGQYDGDLKAWAEKTVARVYAAGFKGLGAWSHPILHEFDVPMTRDLNIWKHYHSGNYKLYSPDWESYGDILISKLVGPYRDNRNLVGYFTDNELDWSDASVGPSMYFDGLEPQDPNRRQVIATIQQLWPTIGEFNAAWKTDYADFTAFDALAKLPRDPVESYNKLFSHCLEKLAGDYFRMTTQLIRKHDPNHLVLGVRFAGYAPREVVRASKPWTDAQSLNSYVADGLLDPDMFRMIYEESGQPIMITEYAFHSLDNRSGSRNTFGFQAQVADQQARAEGYALFTSRLARVPYIIGADWFQWSDEPASGRSSDGEDVNFGVVDVDDVPYEKLVQAIQQTAPQLNPLHAASPTDNQVGLWRDSFMANKPTAYVGKLDKPIVINGNLSDWPERYKLQGVRTTETIGVGRTSLRQPNVYLAWTDSGLYLGFEVFDRDLEAVPATGRWWTRDSTEWWISTRPVTTDQQVYNAYCHQFYYVPNSVPLDGVLGVVAQWHRPGDALTENLIPHPDIIHQSRVYPDRYIVELFIPGKAMNGWDPANQPELAFNMHVRNFHQALDYFWSAPKEANTQMRPSTWGKLVLSNEQFAKQ